MNSVIALKKAKSYTDESLLGGGAVVGKNVTISSITPITGGNRVTFSYTLDDGTVKTSTMDVMDGKDGVDGTNGTNGKDGSDGIGISKIEKIGTVDLIDTYRITFTDNSTFDYEVKNGKDGQGGTGSGEENKIDSISVNGVNVEIDENKNVDITVPDAYDDTDIRAELAKKADTDHTHTTVNGHTVESDVPVDAKFTDTVYDDTQVKTQIQAVANGLMDSVGYSADYKSIDIIAKNGVKKSVNVAPIISHASITELSDVDTTNKATGKALVYNATTSKHEYADVSGSDEKVKMDASTDAKYLGELLDNVTIANENGELKVKKLDGQEVTITEINYLKGLTMNVMDLVNMFSNGGVKIINTPVATYAELLTLDKSSFIEGISYLVYVLADENHDNAKTTYLVDKDSEIPTYFGFADSQRDFTTNPIDLATEITGKLGIANMDSDAIKALFTVDDTYKTETVTNNAFSTHGAKALYDELLLAIGNKANDSDLTAHKDDTDIHVSTEDRTKWDSAKTHADSAHAPSNAQANVLETVKVNGTALTPSSKAVNVTVPTTVAQLTDSADYAKTADLHSHDNKSVLDGITSNKITAWDNKSEFSGSYNDLNDKPTIDAELSNTSENAIQNKVVTKEINKLYSDISFNDFDTATDGTSFTDAEDGNMIVTDWTKNLLNATINTVTANEVTCTNNGDGTYTLNGTATTDFLERSDKFPIPTELKNKTLIFYDGLPDSLRGYACVRFFDAKGELIGELNKTVHEMKISKATHYDFAMFSMAGVVNDNLLLKPILTTDLSATYDDFVPYGGYEIQSCGKNLINFLKIPFICNSLATYTINNGILDISCNEINNSGLFFPMNKIFNYFMRRKFKISFDAKASVGGKFNIGVEGIKMNLFDVGTEYERKVLEFEAVLNGYFDIYNMSGVSQHLYVKDFMIDIVDELDGTPTAYEPYTGETITVTNDTESPAFGLKSHKGITNIISPGNVKCVYPTNESGKGVLDSLYNKDKMLTEQKESLVEQKMLGWTVPSECPIQNYVDSDGVFHQIVGRVDLGSLNWNYISNGQFFYADLQGGKIGSNNAYCSRYNLSNSSAYGGMANGEFRLSVSSETVSRVYVKDTSYTDATTLKQAIKGVYLYYELETPITMPIDGNEAVTKVNESLGALGKCKNLLNPTFETTTINGVTCTNNGDGTYTLNGTASSDTYFILKDITKFEDGKYKIVGFKNPTDIYFVYVNAIRRLDGVTEHTKLHEKYFQKVYLSNDVYKIIQIGIAVFRGTTLTNEIVKPMLTTNLNATYDDFVPYTGDGDTLTHDVAELKNDLGGLTFSASGTTLSITDGTHTWTLEANS